MTAGPPMCLGLISVRSVLVLTLTFLCALPLTLLTSAMTHDLYHDYCIIGAGPAGLQMGYFLKKNNRDYMIFERSNISGHFFKTYPRHRKLISINKRNTGITNKEFNLRHDWNSLLSDDESLLFTKYSKAMFPPADRLLDYLRDYQQKLGLKVQWNTEVSDIHNVQNLSTPDGVLHVFSDQRGQQYTCKVLVVATGMWKPHIPKTEGIELTVGYEDMSIDPNDYEGKNVMIMGNGNSAFEVAQDLYGVTNFIHMVSKSRIRLSWQTHYVGDVRAVNMDLIDTYQLKSLDALADRFWAESVSIRRLGEKLQVRGNVDVSLDNSPGRELYDVIIRCLGFTFDDGIFRNRTAETVKYLPILHNYEHRSMPGVFVAGAASHSLDYKKSAGGFIHGFRYTARALSRLLEWRYEGVPWPSQHLGLPVVQLMNVLVKRLNEASGPYQMFQVLGDIVVFSEDGKRFDYFEEFPIELLPEFPRYTGRAASSRVLAVVLQYGADFSAPGKDTIGRGRGTLRPERAYKGNFLHPVLYYYHVLPTEKQMKGRSSEETLPRPDAVHHVVEDFLTRWDGVMAHHMPIRHFLESVLSTDLRNCFPEECFQDAMTHRQVKPGCQGFYLPGQAPAHQTRHYM